MPPQHGLERYQQVHSAHKAMAHDPRINQFLAGSPHAVVGASTNRAKYGNKVLRAYLQACRGVIPVHPSAHAVEGIKAFSNLSAITEPLHGISIVTPPEVSQKIVALAINLGVRNIWLQPGAENAATLAIAEQSGVNVISGGPCILVNLQFREESP
tara:strand:+ start:900 stop:1367 length:468 start_codon:yes stop_codon:yes gene_type:complete